MLYTLMPMLIRTLQLLAGAVFFAASSLPQDDTFSANRRLGRGINLPGVFDRRGEPVPDPPLKPEYIRKIKDAGFSNVRLVIRWSSYAGQEAPYTIDPDYLRKVDWTVKECLRNELAVVLDFHYYPLISFTGTEVSKEDPARNRARFLGLWKQVAEHYGDWPPEVMFGILNEPSRHNLGSDGWNQLVAESIPLLRASNPRRVILVQSASGGGFATLKDLVLPETENRLIVEVHYYDPGRFTHQQASWSSNRIYKDITWTANDGEKLEVTDAFRRVAEWARRHNRPLYLGEFGAYQAADMPSRVKWTSFVAGTAAEYGMSFAYWGFWRCGFDLFDAKTETWREPLLKALVR